VTFDLSGDFETRGYLRNVAKAKDPAVVQRLQHNSFLTGIDAEPAVDAGSLSFGQRPQ
jgi:cell filamentation protein